MNTELLLLKGLVSEMPEEDQATIKEAAKEFRELVEKYGAQSHGLMAIGMVMMELSENL